MGISSIKIIHQNAFKKIKKKLSKNAALPKLESGSLPVHERNSRSNVRLHFLEVFFERILMDFFSWTRYPLIFSPYFFLFCVPPCLTAEAVRGWGVVLYW